MTDPLLSVAEACEALTVAGDSVALRRLASDGEPGPAATLAEVALALHLGQGVAAREAALRLRVTAPDSPTALSYLAMAERLTGEFEAAVADARAAVALAARPAQPVLPSGATRHEGDPAVNRARLVLANLLSTMGAPEEAAGEYRRILASEPDHVAALVGLAALVNHLPVENVGWKIGRDERWNGGWCQVAARRGLG